MHENESNKAPLTNEEYWKLTVKNIYIKIIRAVEKQNIGTFSFKSNKILL